ncbi:MAG: transcription antitermination factor NusB [Candidatus Omnitrophica bacterium]|nr:transcription antitermination factor NusB [Candidatus Omnitrophota bacterium]
MCRRTRARQYALQMLYEIDITHNSTEEVIKDFWQNHVGRDTPQDIKDFAEFLTRGVINNLSKINSQISLHSQNWSLDRMTVIDRNILRLASFELIFSQDTPPKVVINEAVELAKKFSGQEAAKFVNGILDKIKEKNR